MKLLLRQNYRLWLALGFGLLLAGAFVHWLLFAASQRDNIREAAIRAIAGGRSTGANAAPAVFVSIDGRDPDDGFLRRFRQNQPAVYKLSQGVQVTPFDVFTRYWVDPATGRKGGAVSLGRITWLGPLTARIQVDFPTNGETLTLTRGAVGWEVVSRQMTWMH